MEIVPANRPWKACFATGQGRQGRLHARQRGLHIDGDPGKSRQACARRPSPSTATLPNGGDGCLFPPHTIWRRPRRIRSHFLWPAVEKDTLQPIDVFRMLASSQHATSLPPANDFRRVELSEIDHSWTVSRLDTYTAQAYGLAQGSGSRNAPAAPKDFRFGGTPCH